MNSNLRQCFSAVVSGDNKKLEQLITSVNVNEGKGEHTLLHASAENGNTQTLRTLLKHRADVNATDKNGMTPLQVAIERQHWDAYQLLKSAGTNLEIADKSGARALHWAVQTENIQITSDLLQSNVEVAPKAKFDSIPFHLCARVGSVPLMKLLIQYNSPIEAATKGHTALHIAAMKGFTNLAEELLNNGATIECTNNRGATPLHLAASAGKQEVFSLLLSNKADPMTVDADGNTPVDIARSKGYNELVELAGNPPAPEPTPDSTVALALYPYNESIFKDQHREGDLSFTAGSVITEIKEDDSGWWEGTCQNVRGVFPSNYVSNTPIGKAKCIHNFYATKPDEVNIKKGDDITIYERRNSGWLRVICSGKGGLIPPTHIREIKANATLNAQPKPQIRAPAPAPNSAIAKPKFSQTQPIKKATPTRSAPPPATTGPPPPPATSGPPPMPGATGANFKTPKSPAPTRPAPKIAVPTVPKARVLYAYAAQHPGDLELTVGTIVELTKTEGGWWEGIYNGARGIFPANYVERI